MTAKKKKGLAMVKKNLEEKKITGGQEKLGGENLPSGNMSDGTRKGE